MPESSTAPSTAEHSEVEDRFEDANEVDQSSNPSSPTEASSGPVQPSSPSLSNTTKPDVEESDVSTIHRDDAKKENGVLENGGTHTERERRASESQSATRKDSVSSNGTRSQSIRDRIAAFDQKETPAKDTSMKPPPRPSRFPGFSASLPSVPWGTGAAKQTAQRSPSPQPSAPSQPSQPAATGRKMTTPFGWLSRAATTPKSPPLPARPYNEARRNTAASVSTLGSNADLTLKAIDESTDNGNGGRGPARNSLRERFKLLRLQEEVGAAALEGTELSENDKSSPTVEHKGSLSVDTGLSLDLRNGGPKSPLTPGLRDISPIINPNLAPGTVSGIATAASDAAIPIDWDFWQTVVNEGPQAVARTSPEELTTAIAGGIPSTIRGVIWQVLAGSKNEDLELVYHDLKVRGTKDEIRDSVPSIASLSIHQDGKEKDSVVSSRSSVKSEQSTPATNVHAGVLSPSPSHELPDPVNSAKFEAQMTAERTKKAKEDAAALTKLEKMIRRDMGSRTSYSKYAAAAGFQDGLFNVCKAYALFDDAVGYPQGMNFIIMPLLFTMPEEEAFCLLVRLMNKYQLRELFINDMPGLHLHLYQFERLLEDLEPALYCHLNRRAVTPKLYATQWFLTLFAYRFPLQLVMRVFDLVLCEGLEGAILKFGIALMQKNVDILLGMNDMQALTNHLKEKIFDVYIDAAPSSKSLLESGFFGNSGGTDTEVYRADLLVQDACAIKLTPEMLSRYTSEWEDKTKSERARETELENLRTDTVTKAAQIRSLEKRAEKSDSEHIEIVNELVKLKVENQDLVDQNESLKGQVQELRKVAESEATNVEERLRAGTEQVMQRNIEVQNENRHMEEQMAEMEKELVQMKMRYAELNDEHETLKQRWTDLRKALG